MEYSSVNCMNKYGKERWDKCARDDATYYGRLSFYILLGIFSLFFIYGSFVSYKLLKSKKILHSGLYVFYALGMLTLLGKYS